MKNLFLLLLLITGFGLQAQNADLPAGEKLVKTKLSSVLNKIAVSATVATPSFSDEEIKDLTWKKVAGVSLSDLNISYKMTSRFSFGISTMNNLGNCRSGYVNGEGAVVAFHSDDDDDDDEFHDDDDEYEIDDDDDEEEFEEEDGDDDDDDDDCDEAELDNLLGTVTFKISEKFPFFIQAAGGYSFGNNAPVYSTMIGYNQRIFAGLGIVGGIRFSDVLYKKPADAVSLTPSNGFKAELGLSWNF